MTKLSAANNPMRRDEETRTSCPNLFSPAHDEASQPAPPFDPDSTEGRELEVRFRDPRDLRFLAEYYARRCRASPEDMLSAAVVHAIRRPHWDGGVAARMDGILSSHAYSINRTRRRLQLKGVELVSDNDGSIIDLNWPSPRNPAEESEREARRAGAIKALELIAGDDAAITKLIDGICMRYRGRHLRGELGISELELAALRRRLKRTARSICLLLCVDGVIDADLLQGFAA